MAAVETTLESGDKLSRLNAGVGLRPPGDTLAPSPGAGDPRRNALKQIGALLTASAQRRFKTQEFSGLSWLPRAVPNVMGIVSDINAGSNPNRERRGEQRPANIDTGRLRSSISWRVLDEDTVQVGSNLHYAGIAQLGGLSVLPVTARTKDGIRALITQRPEWADRLQGLLDDDLNEVSNERPERIYVGLDESDRDKVGKIIERWLGGGSFEVS